MRAPRLALPILLVSAFALGGCATVDVSSERYLGIPRAAPTDPARVEILRHEPKRAHVRLGEVFLSPTGSAGTDELELALRKEAAKLGADAAVVVHDRTRRVGTFVSGSWWVRHYAPVYGRQVVAVAIRYQGP